MNWENSVVVATGSRGGVGKLIMAHFEEQNVMCIGIDKTPSETEDKGVYIQADLSNLESVKKAVKKISKVTDKVDLLINAAGVFISDAECEAQSKKSVYLWENNLLTYYYTSVEMFELLKLSKKASIINISSADGIVASSGQTCEIGTSHDMLYAASKGAVNTLTKAMAMKWASFNIRVNAICPTIIRTPMTKTILDIAGKEEELTGFIPLGRICEPKDIVSAVIKLHELEMTTGHLLNIDGGYLCQ